MGIRRSRRQSSDRFSRRGGVKKKLILLGVFSLLVGVSSLVLWGQYRQRSADLYYSGTLESTQSNLSFQVSGRVKQVNLDEGQSVKAGQCIAELDPEEFQARLDQARANMNQAIENRKQLEANLEIYQNTLPADVSRAESAVKASAAQLADQEKGNRSQDVERARLSFQEAEITMEDARKDKRRFDDLFRSGFIAEKERDDVALRYETAVKALRRAAEAYDLAKEGFRKESIDAAMARLSEAQAGLLLSKGNLKKIEAAQADIQAAIARIQSVASALNLAEIQLGYTRLLSPFDAMLTSRNVEPGEVVTPGREVISLADLSRIDLKVFVDETQIGKVRPGQKTEVKIDTFPDKTYNGFISYISPEGEFTPKIIQTRKERVKLVFLVKISLANPNMELKSGMPADAWFR
jgi:HlyD family secretion protein